MRTGLREWQLRPNRLRRRSDVVEAWTVMAAAVLLVLGAPLAGLVAGRLAYDGAASAARALRAERHPVRAEVLGDMPPPLPALQGGRPVTQHATVRWSEPEGTERTTRAAVPADARRGDVIELWLDSRDRVVAPPPDASSVWQHTFAMGICGAGGTAGPTLVAHTLFRRAAARRRLAEWGRDWARVEPRWTGRGG
ncbi:hypothetical protein ABZZ79_15980 [Streptomyces sp. NPDC006458]|uniref:Rv1733c family protein n=1 Tax=Streptomyces sp. NPDC006458 TaxID=3154302 RepID=UPI0033AA5D3A